MLINGSEVNATECAKQKTKNEERKKISLLLEYNYDELYLFDVFPVKMLIEIENITLSF